MLLTYGCSWLPCYLWLSRFGGLHLQTSEHDIMTYLASDGSRHAVALPDSLGRQTESQTCWHLLETARCLKRGLDEASEGQAVAEVGSHGTIPLNV